MPERRFESSTLPILGWSVATLTDGWAVKSGNIDSTQVLHSEDYLTENRDKKKNIYIYGPHTYKPAYLKHAHVTTSLVSTSRAHSYGIFSVFPGGKQTLLSEGIQAVSNNNASFYIPITFTCRVTN
jgi:hypothetical protein